MRTGLCHACESRRLVVTARGSRFSLCRKSLEDPRFDRYPRLPVLECAGFSERAELGAARR